MLTAPLPENEAERLEALRQYDILDTEPETVYDEAVKTAASLCRTPVASISLLDGDRQWFKSVYGTDMRQTPRDVSFCSHALLQPDLLIVPDARQDPRFADNPLVTGDPHVRFYAGAPLVSPEGHALGALCVIDRVPHEITADQQEVLRILARQVMAQLELRRRAALQERLAEERERADRRFRALFETMTQGVVYQDEGGVFTDANPAAQRILGRTLDEMRGRTPHDLGWQVAAEDGLPRPDQDHPALRAPGEGGPTCDALLSVYNPALDQRRWLLARFMPLVGTGGGAPGGAYSVFDDVTERRQAEAEQRQSDEALRLMGAALRSAVDGITIADARRPDFPLTYCNPAFLALTGYAEHEVLGRNCRFLQGEDTDPEARREVREALAAGRACRVVLRNYRKDGTPFWNALTVAPILDAGGTPTHYVGILHDVTERRQTALVLQESERRLRLALESGHLGTFQIDLKTGRFLELSDACRAQLGLAPGRDFSLPKFFALVHPDDRAQVQAEMAHSHAAQEHDLAWEYRIVLPDGRMRWISVHGLRNYEADGTPLRTVGMTQDVTEQKAREADRETALREAEERADCDPLTGLFNHRAFHRQFALQADRARRGGTTLAVVVLDLDNFRFFNDVYGHGVGDEVLQVIAARLRWICRPDDVLARFGGDEFALLLPDVGAEGAEEIEARLRAGLGDILYRAAETEAAIPVTLSLAAALFSGPGPDRHEILRRADERLHWLKTGGGTASEALAVRDQARSHVQGFSMLDALVTAVDNKDRYTRRHSEDVMDYSLRIARALGMDEKTQHTLGVAALLHDVGKIGVPDAILRKPGKLTDEEFAAVQQHPMMGAIIVGAVPGLEETLDAVRHHHERWDGGGYPFGLRGEETPVSARLMAVADAYSAMTTDRPYRQGMDPAKAQGILRSGAGSQWDAACVEAFLRGAG